MARTKPRRHKYVRRGEISGLVVVDQSDDVYANEPDTSQFFGLGIFALGGGVEKAGNDYFLVELPDSL